MKIINNVILSIVLIITGVFLIFKGSITFRERWNPNNYYIFEGLSLYSISISIILLGIFSASVAYMSIRDNMSNEDYDKGYFVFKFWYVLLPIIPLIITAFLFSEKVYGL